MCYLISKIYWNTLLLNQFSKKYGLARFCSQCLNKIKLCKLILDTHNSSHVHQHSLPKFLADRMAVSSTRFSPPRPCMYVAVIADAAEIIAYLVSPVPYKETM